MAHKVDIESDGKTSPPDEKAVSDIDIEEGAVYTAQLAQGDAWTAKLQRVFGKYKIEQRGIERVPEDERTDTNGVVNVGTMVCCSRSSSSHTTDHIKIPVACGEHGRELVRDRRPRDAGVWAWLRRHDPHDPVREHARYHPSRVLVDVWTRIWFAPDGALPVLLWLPRRKD
jgi:hypothetical protein